MQKETMKTIEKARKEYLETFQGENLFLKVFFEEFYDSYYCAVTDGNQERIKHIFKKLEKCEGLEMKIAEEILSKENSQEMIHKFKAGMEKYLENVKDSLILGKEDSQLVLGFKLGHYTQKLRFNLKNFLQYANISKKMKQRYIKEYFAYIKKLKEIVGLDEEIEGTQFFF